MVISLQTILTNTLHQFILFLYHLNKHFFHTRTECELGFSWECLLHWGQFYRLALAGMFMICIEWWVFEIGTFMAGMFSKLSFLIFYQNSVLLKDQIFAMDRQVFLVQRNLVHNP